MKNNPDLLDLVGVCAYFGLSESTIRRKVRESRNGVSNFPLPLLRSRCRVLFRKSDIEAWRGEDAETVMFTPSQVSPIPQTTPTQSATQVRKGLEALGVRLPN